MSYISVFIPDNLAPVENEIKTFFEAMVYKLRKNSGKGHWDELSLIQVLELMRKEMAELEEAINEGASFEITLEASDIANFALMAASIALGMRDGRTNSVVAHDEAVEKANPHLRGQTKGY